MKSTHHSRGRLLFAVFSAILVVGFAANTFAADPPVKVTVTISGDAVPGATVTAKAAVTINDGTTLQGIQWTQKSGVKATLVNTTGDTVNITLPDRATFKQALITAAEEAPIAQSDYPAWVPKTEFANGLQNRFTVIGVAPLTLEDGTAVNLDVAVTTSSGTYHTAAPIVANVPWTTSTGLRNVPTLLPVLLQGKKQATYNWTLTVPQGSTAKLNDAATQNPDFTPDVAGAYVLSVTDVATGKTVNITVNAGTWKGILVGQDSKGRPTVDKACTGCHVPGTPTFDLFTPWANSGHSEIFTQNVNTPANHYATSCLGCHTVGFNATAVKNNGIDDQSDFQAMVDSGLIQHADKGNWDKILAQFPNAARFTNIQCENCHGPQNSVAHNSSDTRLRPWDAQYSRMSLSSDVCGSCHGEPTRHGRFQQWQLSGHANYEVATSEGTDATCAKCHSAQGFLQWQDKGFSTANLTVTWTADDVHPQTCQTCHDPHDMGTTSGDANTNAKVRVMGKTPLLMAGFTANNVGSAATCMTCHNGRRGLKDDAHFDTTDLTRAPHEGPQADIVMGQNLYFAKVGTAGFHGQIQDVCVSCHMEKTPPPTTLSNAGGGTNHTFYASTAICSKCHTEITAESVQGPIVTKLASLKGQLETSIKTALQTQIRLGNAIDLNGQKTIKNANDIAKVEFISSHGRQGAIVTLANGTSIPDLSLQAVKVVRPSGSSVEIYSLIDPAIAKSGWNYLMVQADKSKGVHNPAFVNSALDVSLFAVTTLNTNGTVTLGTGGAKDTGIGGGVGNGAGAVSCTTPFVYWTEIAGHNPGLAGSQWRTDLVARNLSTNDANVKFILHQATAANLEGNGVVTGSSLKAFEDVIGLIGGANNIGSLEICSDQPLLVAGRIFNQGGVGTFGQNFDGRVADLGYGAGQTVSLIGLRQKTDTFRSNITVTNAGKTDAQVTINLFDATGKSLTKYDLAIPAGQALQDTEPFKNRASAPDVDWGFATITVVKGNNILTSGSMIDMKTNDPTTIPAKQ
ncbi:MAG TPA: hypothetical protein VF980_05070 [Thermoanaerobaculia bacterium]